MEFSELIDKYIKEKQERDVHFKVRGKYSPSDLGKPCMRQAYFKAVAEEVEWPVEKLRIFEAGNIVHDFSQEIAKRDSRFDFVEAESKFFCIVPDEKELITISGRADIVAREKDSEKVVVFEIKSIKNLYYRRETPMDEHVNQLMLYLGCMHAPEGYIVYIDKNTLEAVTHRVEYNHARFLEMLEGICKLHYYVVTETVPNPAFDPLSTRWPCEYCLFRQDCVSMINGENKKPEKEGNDEKRNNNGAV